MEKKSYIVLFWLVVTLGLSVFLYYTLSGYIFYQAEHSIKRNVLLMIFGKRLPNYAEGLVNMFWRFLSYGTMGLIGVFLASKIGFKEIVNKEIKQPKTVRNIFITGAILGIYFIIINFIYETKYFYPISTLRRSEMPGGIFASVAEAIGDQIKIMFYIVILLWIFYKIVKSEEGRSKLFKAVVIFSAWLFILEHKEYTWVYNANIHKNIFQIRQLDFFLLIGLYAPIPLVCSFYLKKYGLLSAIAVHFICDFMWNILFAWILMGNEMFGQNSNTISLQFRLITAGLFIIICIAIILLVILYCKKQAMLEEPVIKE